MIADSDVQTSAETHLAGFQAYQRRKGKAAGTVKQYGQYLRPFVAWVGPRDWSDITAAEIENGWLALWDEDMFQRLGRRPTAKTLRNHFDALRAFGDI